MISEEKQSIDIIPDFYPYTEGDHLILGPEIFTDLEGKVICWKGVNYIKQKVVIKGIKPTEMNSEG